jgi:uncharacterized protein YdeI (YjbR/CyaY-like superfamily)
MTNRTTHRLAAVDGYIAKSAAFAQPILEMLRDVVHEGAPGVVEEIKWSRPFFVYKGVILGNLSAFQKHCSFGLWGSEIAGELRQAGVASGEGMGTFGRITAVQDLPARKQMVGYVRLAAKAIDDGVRTKAWVRPRVAKAETMVPEALAIGLEQNKQASTHWSAMTPGCRREYCTWIAEARREDTRTKRVVQAVEWIAQGKARNWKYEQGEGANGKGHQK